MLEDYFNSFTITYSKLRSLIGNKDINYPNCEITLELLMKNAPINVFRAANKVLHEVERETHGY